MLRRILVPLDGSEIAEAILGPVVHLIRTRGATLILMRAIPVPLHPRPGSAPFSLRDTKAEAERYLSALARELRKNSVRVLGVVHVGREAGGILEVARDEGATLIAMATHGRTGRSHCVFGSVTEQVLRKSEIPVLILRSFEQVAAGAARTSAHEVPIRRILMPVLGTGNSLAALPHVRSLAGAFGASVIVLGVVEPAGRRSSCKGDPLVRVAVDALSHDHIAVDPLFRLGDPASEILDASRTHDADLVAMATQGRKGVSRPVAGSVAEKVLRELKSPVLVVRGERGRGSETVAGRGA
ncbi:MAG: universal stress protein [Planctomycetes bacterium]|nr:universal stress protein [Planctomycetota bacterium]